MTVKALALFVLSFSVNSTATTSLPPRFCQQILTEAAARPEVLAERDAVINLGALEVTTKNGQVVSKKTSTHEDVLEFFENGIRTRVIRSEPSGSNLRTEYDSYGRPTLQVLLSSAGKPIMKIQYDKDGLGTLWNYDSDSTPVFSMRFTEWGQTNLGATFLLTKKSHWTTPDGTNYTAKADKSGAVRVDFSNTETGAYGYMHFMNGSAHGESHHHAPGYSLVGFFENGKRVGNWITNSEVGPTKTSSSTKYRHGIATNSVTVSTNGNEIHQTVTDYTSSGRIRSVFVDGKIKEVHHYDGPKVLVEYYQQEEVGSRELRFIGGNIIEKTNYLGGDSSKTIYENGQAIRHQTINTIVSTRYENGLKISDIQDLDQPEVTRTVLHTAVSGLPLVRFVWDSKSGRVVREQTYLNGEIVREQDYPNP